MEAEKKTVYNLAKRPTVPKQRLFQKNVKVVSNHFDVDVSKLNMKEFYLYKIKIGPQINLDNRKLKHQILSSLKDEMSQCVGQYFCTGWVLFGEKLKEGVNILETKANNKEYVVDIQIIMTKGGKPKKVDISDIHTKEAIVNEKEIIQFLNSIMKQSMRQVGYKDIGIISKYYDTKNEQFVNNCDLKVYKGFYVSIDLYQGKKFKLLVDLSTRVLQSRDCLSFMNMFKDRQEVENNVVGNSVIAQYGNNRTYYIDDIMYNMNTNNTFDCKGKTISYKEYYQKTYGLTIKQAKQPLLLSIKREKDCNQKIIEKKIYLIPELVNLTGMTDRQRSDFKVMQELAKYTKMYPDQRIEGQDILVDKISDNLNENKLPIKLNDANYVNAMVFTNPRIRTSKDIHPQNGDFKRDYRGAVHEPSRFTNWLVVYHQDNYNDADNFVNTMMQCAGAYGIQIKNPEFTEIKGNDIKTWEEYTLEDFQYFKGIQIIVVLLPNRGQDRIYNIMKETCHNKLGVMCQCVRPRTLTKNTKSVCSNILLQMNAKSNNILWKVERPNGLQNNTMLVGIDVHHGGVGKKKFSIVGFTTTMDNDFTKYYSRISVQEKKDQEIISKGIVNLLEQSLMEYFKLNKKLPVQIIIFRDGVGDSMFYHVLEKELNQVEVCIEQMANKTKQNYSPKLAMIVVDKKIKDKFYVPNADPSRNQPMQSRGRGQRGQQKISSAYSNCESGTIVDSQVVHMNYWQFFMVAQHVNQGTATPTRYILIQNTTDLNSDQIQQVAYFQCFNYYNWPGAVKVPAVVQYANNVAKHCGQVYKAKPQEKEPLNMSHWLYHL